MKPKPCQGCGGAKSAGPGRKYCDNCPVRARQIADRFWSKVRQAGECWEWTGALSDGYGSFYIDEDTRDAKPHRWSYEELRAEIPEGLTLDHLCRNRACVNPWHLEPVTRAVNTQRGDAPSIRLNRARHCLKGHPMSGANLYIIPSSGQRRCRTCNREYDRARSQRRLQRSAA